MILEDFVMLGTTVPEPNSDGRIFVCSAGVSRERRSLVRLYPLARRNIPHRWNIHRVPVELNPADSRPESYKVAGDRRPGAHENINSRFEVVGRVRPNQRAALLAPYWVGSIAEANARRLSLAIVAPQNLDLYFEHNPYSPDSPQLALFDDGLKRPTAGARRFPYIPRLYFRDADGEHRLMLRDWGCYELMRKMPERRTEMADFLHLGPSSSLLVGNLANRRTAWLVISVLNGIRDEAPALFDIKGVA
jgi:hypothetical protein